jgi:hypothetical protein
MARNTNRSPKPAAANAAVEATSVEDVVEARGGAALTTQENGASTALAAYTAPEEFTGFEDVEASDLKVPFVLALQAQSPQAMRGNPKFVEGAQASDLWNNLTNELYPGAIGVPFVPVMRVREELEYVPRDKGGGLVARHDPKDPRIAALRKRFPFAKAPIGDGNELVESVKLYGYMQNPKTGKWEPAIVPFVSTNMESYKRFFSLAMTQRYELPGTSPVQTAQYPMRAHRWRLTTKFEQNKKGQWYKLVLALDGPSFEAARLAPTDPVYQEATQFAKLIAAGRVVEHSEGVTDTQPADDIDEL